MVKCRACETPITKSFVDLGVSPLGNSYLRPDQMADMEPFYPLHALVCDECLLVQLDEFESPEHIFTEYAYFSSYSSTWLDHSRQYVDDVVKRFGIGTSSFVVEIASNDGYLLKNFVRLGIPCLGIEPAQNVAEVARKIAVPTHCAFFNRAEAGRLLSQYRRADLMVANNVFAHVSQLNSFVAGFKLFLAADGVITFEFPHLLQLIENGQFDTIYHEHFSYFSLHSAKSVLARHGLRIFDVETLPTHGGSLRLFVCHDESKKHESQPRVAALGDLEKKAGLEGIDGYTGFAETVHRIKRDLLGFLIKAREGGKRIAAYGAPAKGNTLLNFCGIGTDFVDFTVDKSPHKQGKFLPGSRIPILRPEELAARKPDYVWILPWNLEAEIIKQCREDYGVKATFFVSHPRLKVIP
ncbi:MAG: class I SAM-dependent methyltransferase [Bdellovibrionota bacterium]